MSGLATTRRRLRSAETLQGVVTTMKTLASVRIVQYRRSVAALRESTRTLELAVQALLTVRPELLTAAPGRDAGTVALVVLGSDRGLAGPFNERMVRHAAGLLRDRVPAGEAPSVLAVGRRLTARLRGAGFAPDVQVSPPSSVEAIEDAVAEVLVHLDSWLLEGRAQRLYLAYNRPTRGAGYEPSALRILPVDERWLARLHKRPWPTDRLPVALGDGETLLRGLVRNFLAHALVQAFAASQASENAARLAAMDAAERNVEERLDQLRTEYRQARQNAVTAELMDVQAAYLAVDR